MSETKTPKVGDLVQMEAKAYPIVAVGPNLVVLSTPDNKLIVLGRDRTEAVDVPPPMVEPSVPTVEIDPKDEIETPSAQLQREGRLSSL